MSDLYIKQTCGYDPQYFIKRRRIRLYGPEPVYKPPVLPDGTRQWLVKAKPHPNFEYEDKYVYAKTSEEAKRKLQKLFPWYRCIGPIDPSDLDTSDRRKYLVIE